MRSSGENHQDYSAKLNAQAHLDRDRNRLDVEHDVHKCQ